MRTDAEILDWFDRGGWPTEKRNRRINVMIAEQTNNRRYRQQRIEWERGQLREVVSGIIDRDEK